MKRFTAYITAMFIALISYAGSPKLPATPVRLDGYHNVDSVVARMATMPLDVIEGLWQFSGNGSRVVIVKVTREMNVKANYAVVIIDGADRTLRPGTVIGLINRGGERGTYIATFYKEHNLTTPGLSGRRVFTLNLASDRAFMRFIPQNPKLRIYLPSLLPGIAGRVIRKGYENRPADGCIRLFPEPLKPVEPRYL